MDIVNPCPPDKRHATRNRFGWVKRLMQGQTRTQAIPIAEPNLRTSATTPIKQRQSQNHQQKAIRDNQTKSKRFAADGTIRERANSDPLSNDPDDNFDLTIRQVASNGSSRDGINDQTSDNLSTIPLKSIMSTQSTKSPSILSQSHNDQQSMDASTTETSLAPSIQAAPHYTFVPNNAHSNVILTNSSAFHDRDSESIVTLASSSRRIRRRSIDTSSSTTGIPPASIIERLGVHPASSTYATSVRTGDRLSHIDTANDDDQASSVQSFN